MGTSIRAPGGSTIQAPLPLPPQRQFSFTDFSTNNPTAQQPGDRMDAEYDRGYASISQLITFCSVTFNTDGTLKPGSVGTAQLDPSIVGDMVADITNQVQPLVDDAFAAAGAASQSATNSQTSALHSETQNQAAQQAASTAAVAADTASQASQHAQTSQNSADASASQAAQAANDAQGSEAICEDYGSVCQAWAEYMPDTIPPNILAVMGVTGDHWSSRWWANHASELVQDADNKLNDLGQYWVDLINETGSENQQDLEQQFESYLTQFQTLYLGAFYYPPVTDSFGNPVATGAIYYNITLQAPYVWNGTAWVPFLTVGPSQVYRYVYVATAGQTVFSGADRAGNNLQYNSANRESVSVFHSKLLLTPSDDYAAGVDEVTLNTPAAAGDIVQIWVDSVPLVQLDWQTVKLDTSTWNISGGPLQDANGNPVLPASATDVFVSVNGVWQNAFVDYTVSSSTISFTKDLEGDANTFAIAIVPTQAQPPQSSAVTQINTASWVFDGTTTAFNLVDANNDPITPASAASVLLSLNGVWQAAQTAYTVSSSILTFTVAPEPDAQVFGVAGLP